MRKKTYIGYILGAAICMMAVLSGCGTKKKSREELSLLGKAYHNTTALYNGYFNANEIMEATYLKLENEHKDNYTQMLRVFPYEGGNPDGVKAELDRAIEKVSIVATVHEPSKWRDDCYVLLCEAQYLQQDYETAEESLKFTVHEFDPINMAKKRKKALRKAGKREKSKKEINRERRKKNKKRRKKRKRMTREERAKQEAKEKAEAEEARLKEIKEKQEAERKAAEEQNAGDWLGHRPVYQDAVLWLARTYTKRDKFSLADSYFRRLEEDPGVHQDVREVMYAARAMYYFEQERWEQAEAPMEKALVNAPDRKTKARYAYILAQIKEKKGDYAGAEVYFDKALDLRPNYDMIFNAKLRKAVNAKRSGKINGRQFAGEMEDMLKDDKYDDYQDQIYTALAEMSFANGRQEEGIDFLKQALASGDKGSVYKTEAFYQLAQFFFEKENYVDAKLYYDSTLTTMSDDDDRKPEVQLLSTNLTEIANQIQIIALQDSLIKLSKLSREELLRRAEKMQEEEQEAKELAANGGATLSEPPGFQRPVGSAFGTASFFAYNPLLLDKGKRDFKRVWGDRPLEDNWRRANKSSSFFDEEDEEEEVSAVTSEDDQLIEKYFSNVPFEPADLELVHQTREGALFTLGKLYRDKMQNCASSEETLELLIADYPTTQKKADALFYLYLCALEGNDRQKAEAYAQQIVDNYPNTLYAKSIADPDFLAKEKKKKEQLDIYYRETYAMFSDGQYAKVSQRLEEVETLFASQAQYTAKFALLDAMMSGHREGKEAYINGLRDVIAKHKETPEATRAREIMRFLQGDEEAFKVVNNGSAADSKFKVEDDKLHYIATVIFDLGQSKLNDAKNSISSYNRRFHKKSKLNLSTLDLDIENSTPLILIRKFKGKKSAMDYYYDVQKRKDKFLSTKDIQYEVYVISQRNYREVIKEKSIASYRPFFNQYYLESEE